MYRCDLNDAIRVDYMNKSKAMTVYAHKSLISFTVYSQIICPEFGTYGCNGELNWQNW